MMSDIRDWLTEADEEDARKNGRGAWAEGSPEAEKAESTYLTKIAREVKNFAKCWASYSEFHQWLIHGILFLSESEIDLTFPKRLPQDEVQDWLIEELEKLEAEALADAQQEFKEDPVAYCRYHRKTDPRKGPQSPMYDAVLMETCRRWVRSTPYQVWKVMNTVKGRVQETAGEYLLEMAVGQDNGAEVAEVAEKTMEQAMDLKKKEVKGQMAAEQINAAQEVSWNQPPLED